MDYQMVRFSEEDLSGKVTAQFATEGALNCENGIPVSAGSVNPAEPSRLAQLLFTSWVGTCPGREESAEKNSSSRSAKGNKYMRRLLNQAAHAAARSKGTHFQAVFRRLLPRLGYQSAVWAIAHRICRIVWKILTKESATSSRAPSLNQSYSSTERDT
jgi:hypothetical protein